MTPIPKRSIHLVDDCGSGAVEEPDPYETWVPPGDYSVAFLDEVDLRYFGRRCWRCSWRIVDDGPNSDLVLYSWFNLPEDGARVRPSHSLWQAYVVATGLRPPRDLDIHRPSWFLGGCQFLARVRTVDKDPNGVKRPDAASYSRVDHLIERIAGRPPCLKTRTEG